MYWNREEVPNRSTSKEKSCLISMYEEPSSKEDKLPERAFASFWFITERLSKNSLFHECSEKSFNRYKNIIVRIALMIIPEVTSWENPIQIRINPPKNVKNLEIDRIISVLSSFLTRSLNDVAELRYLSFICSFVIQSIN
jgi:hypothetical protein